MQLIQLVLQIVNLFIFTPQKLLDKLIVLLIFCHR